MNIILFPFYNFTQDFLNWTFLGNAHLHSYLLTMICWLYYLFILRSVSLVSFLFYILYMYIYTYIFCCLVAKSHLTLCNPMDCSMSGSSVLQYIYMLSHFSHVQLFATLWSINFPGSSVHVHGSLKVRILKWVSIPSFRGSSQFRDWACISYIACIGSQVLYH